MKLWGRKPKQPVVVLTLVAESDLLWSSVPGHSGYRLTRGKEISFTSVDTLYVRADSKEGRDG